MSVVPLRFNLTTTRHPLATSLLRTTPPNVNPERILGSNPQILPTFLHHGPYYVPVEPGLTEGTSTVQIVFRQDCTMSSLKVKEGRLVPIRCRGV